MAKCATQSGGGVYSISVTLPEGPPTWQRSRTQTLRVAMTGAVPVTNVVIDLVGDGASGWYYSVADGRGTHDWTVFTSARTGRFQILVSVVDVNGCEAMLAPGTYITVQP